MPDVPNLSKQHLIAQLPQSIQDATRDDLLLMIRDQRLMISRLRDDIKDRDIEDGWRATQRMQTRSGGTM